MKKREAIELTLKYETKVRKSTWMKKVFIYYSRKDEKIFWYDGDIFTDINSDFEQSGWEIYREIVVADGVIELFQKHKVICQKTCKNELSWQASFGVILTSSDPADKAARARHKGSDHFVAWDSETVGKTFTLLDDENSKGASHEA